MTGIVNDPWYGCAAVWWTFPLNVAGYFNQTAATSVTFLMCWKPLTSVTLRPGTCSCPVPSGLILMSSFSPSLLSRSLWTTTAEATIARSCSSQRQCIFHNVGKALPQHLIVDLHRADVHCVAPHVLAVLYLFEEVLQSPLVDAGILHRALKIKTPKN